VAFNSIPSAWIVSGRFAIQSLWQYIKDNFDYLYTTIGGLSAVDVPNGSFEIDSDSDGVPDRWTISLYPGGARGIYTTAPADGAQALYFTHPGGAGNGGGYADSDYMPVSSVRAESLCWIHWATAAGMKNQVIIRFYDKGKVYLSSTTLYDSTSNPTSATLALSSFLPPASARFMKVRCVGGESSVNVAGTAYFDGFKLDPSSVLPVVGYAEGTGATGTSADRIHIDGALSSPSNQSTGGSRSGAKASISGGRNVSIDFRDSSNSRLSFNLTLPDGTWAIYATGDYFDPGGNTYYSLTAIAVRGV
jgi:hypothetical protein